MLCWDKTRPTNLTIQPEVSGIHRCKGNTIFSTCQTKSIKLCVKSELNHIILKKSSYLCRLRIEYMHGIDIKEDYLLGLGNGILDKLLLDRTTGGNIIWVTDDYAALF